MEYRINLEVIGQNPNSRCGSTYTVDVKTFATVLRFMDEQVEGKDEKEQETAPATQEAAD